MLVLQGFVPLLNVKPVSKRRVKPRRGGILVEIGFQMHNKAP